MSSSVGEQGEDDLCTSSVGSADVISDDELDKIGPLSMNLGSYSCDFVTNIPASSNDNEPSNPRTYFDLGLRHFYSYQHEEAYKCFLATLALAPDCAFAHGMVALCHCPNYNFKGDAYYESTDQPEEEQTVLAGTEDLTCLRRLYPSQQVAAKHSILAMEKIEELRVRYRKRRWSSSSSITDEGDTQYMQPISDIETHILSAIRTLTSHPGIQPEQAERIVGRPYANALAKVYQRFSTDAEVCYFYAESLMVIHAWKLYDYPTGQPLSSDVDTIEGVLESALELHPDHAGLCHLYVHLCEMSSNPEKALKVCGPLRRNFPDAGHLIHMATHIDVLVGDYASCVDYNLAGIVADEKIMRISPDTAGRESFYFGYAVHNYHMLVYGCILGGMETIALEVANKLNELLNESLFIENPDLSTYLEAYAALDVHVMVRFGRWKEILELPFPKYPLLMLFRTASLHYARGLALANTGRIEEAAEEANLLDKYRLNSCAELRILHNNNVADLLAVDAPMLRGEIAYHSGNYDEAFSFLREAVRLQDGLNYDEPWGKMMPVRHALGGLLCEQGHFDEGESVFRIDLKFHPKNPWAIVGLISCLQNRLNVDGCCKKTKSQGEDAEKLKQEIAELGEMLKIQRTSKWVDFDIVAPCVCCGRSDSVVETNI
mmetsp:Transcript_28014/g.40043  ORF Transcript_28014/g.40043 Transcript_28014/m.40043 type:complete len:660 (-) Transcript_28014:40-2019(-)